MQVAFCQPRYEFRGVWVATVDNIDWPSTKHLTSDSQKAEFIRLLDTHKRNGMNAIIAQIRPATDAFYPSQFEPWSEWLTGIQGKPPVPYYDPLEFMISETHKRGMEFHAWMNPYRAEFMIGTSSISPTHITRIHPEWFLVYGDKKYFDPGNKKVQEFVGGVVQDVVSRYDVDAIHFDDYFYPYRIAGKEFPDTLSYRLYSHNLLKDDWRRSNVDSIIVLLSRIIKKEKRFCKFGISPFGVWRNIDKDPEGSNTKAGQTNYDDLYADILLWVRMKWIDYVAPQLYWEFSQKVVGFATLIEWWSTHAYGRQLFIGQGIYRAGESRSPAWKSPLELPNQIKKLREYRQIQGSVFFSSKTFYKNPNGWNDSLKNNYYKFPAIIPPMAWIDSVKPSAPNFSSFKILNNNHSPQLCTFVGTILNPNTNVSQYAVFKSANKEDLFIAAPAVILPASRELKFEIENMEKETIPFYLTVTGISHTNVESIITTIYRVEKLKGEWSIKKL